MTANGIALNPKILKVELALSGEQPWFFHWVLEREQARCGYEADLPKPWTTDPIVQSYRFCNVRREDDKVTKWIKTNWRAPFDGHVNMVLAMVMARTVNWPDTLEEIGFPDFLPSEFSGWLESTRTQMKHRRAFQHKVWTGAYLVSTNGHQMDKIDYILDRVWEPIYKRFQRPKEQSLAAYHQALMKFDGMGSFMAGQVVADLKYTSELRGAADWNSWAAIGPGSRRGLNRYFGRRLEGAISSQQFLREITLLQNAVVQYCGMAIHAQDIQNCLCEFDKYCRTKNGEGKPRSRYNGR
jgi:hypothetical protein